MGFKNYEGCPQKWVRNYKSKYFLFPISGVIKLPRKQETTVSLWVFTLTPSG